MCSWTRNGCLQSPLEIVESIYVIFAAHFWKIIKLTVMPSALTFPSAAKVAAVLRKEWPEYELIFGNPSFSAMNFGTSVRGFWPMTCFVKRLGWVEVPGLPCRNRGVSSVTSGTSRFKRWRYSLIISPWLTPASLASLGITKL